MVLHHILYRVHHPMYLEKNLSRKSLLNQKGDLQNLAADVGLDIIDKNWLSSITCLGIMLTNNEKKDYTKVITSLKNR